MKTITKMLTADCQSYHIKLGVYTDPPAVPQNVHLRLIELWQRHLVTGMNDLKQDPTNETLRKRVERLAGKLSQAYVDFGIENPQLMF